ncbi:MAG: hypothetical protein AAGC55_19125, partial [Myxococcota bacterium]
MRRQLRNRRVALALGVAAVVHIAAIWLFTGWLDAIRASRSAPARAAVTSPPLAPPESAGQPADQAWSVVLLDRAETGELIEAPLGAHARDSQDTAHPLPAAGI